MRRLAFGSAFVGVAVLGARLIMPRLHARMLAACTHMFEEMPEDFPPRRMMAGIEEIRANTARAVELLTERNQEESVPFGGISPTRAEEVAIVHA